MIPLSEAVGSWLYPGGATSQSSPRRSIVLGAGFTKSCWEGAPNFEALGSVLRDRLKGAEDREKEFLGKAGTSELVELLDHRQGRFAVARAVLAEPAGELRLYPPLDPVSRPPSPREPSTFRSLRQWKEALETTSPTHLNPLRPDGAAVILGRLVAERVVDQILTTNWDAYIELGCLLAGVRVCDGDEKDGGKAPWLRSLAGRLRVFETPGDAALGIRQQEEVTLFKLHGGVRSIQGVLQKRIRGELQPEAAEEELRSSFLVATEDLIHWEVPSQWVADVAADTLRSHAVLTIGVSGADPVLYRAFRSRIREWEKLSRRNASPGVAQLPALVGTDKAPAARVVNMLTIDEALGQPVSRLSKTGGRAVLRSIYGQHLLEQRILGHSTSGDLPSKIGGMLRSRLQEEVSKLDHENETSPSVTPLLDILCDSLGPGARWAAVADERAPFAQVGGSAEAFRRWWYAPWPEDMPAEHRREIASFLAVILEGATGAGTSVEVDPWSGLIHLPPGHFLLRTSERWQFPKTPLGGVSLLPLPWPWRPHLGLAAPWLWDQLATRLHWGPGMALESLARAPVWVVPIPVHPASLSGRTHVTVGGVRASILGAMAETAEAELWSRLAQKVVPG